MYGLIFFFDRFCFRHSGISITTSKFIIDNVKLISEQYLKKKIYLFQSLLITLPYCNSRPIVIDNIFYSQAPKSQYLPSQLQPSPVSTDFFTFFSLHFYLIDFFSAFNDTINHIVILLNIKLCSFLRPF